MPAPQYRKSFHLFISLVLISTVLLCGCYGEAGDDGIQGPAGPTMASISGVVMAEGDTFEASIAINNLSSFPDVTINDTIITIDNYPWMESGDIIFKGYNLPYPDDDTARLEVDYILNDGGDALAEALVEFPAETYISDFEVINNPSTDNVAIYWPAGDLSDAYYLLVDLDYEWVEPIFDTIVDTMVEPPDTVFDTTLTGYANHLVYDTLVYDTARHSIDKFDLYYNPNYVYDSGFSMTGSISLYTVNGPVLSGVESNVTGDATGFLTAMRYVGTEYIGELKSGDGGISKTVPVEDIRYVAGMLENKLKMMLAR